MDTDGMQFENPIDNLTYLYDDTNKNQLLRVFDSTANPQGFSDDSDGISDTEDDYAYDDNGNMTHDDNKGITHITYNHLNLPVEIIFGTYGKIAYLYNATGLKLKKTVTEGTTITTTDYLSGFQYKNLVLQFFPHAEGYVNATEEMVVMGGTSYRFNYVFNYTDHLGNIRLSYSLDPSTKVLKIIEENHYYPFGLKHSGYNSDKMMYTKEAEVLKIKPVPPLFITSYKYKYNGKEYQDELGLNMYDYGARNYDPALGRWMNIDPLAEKSRRFSPYVYALNNPVYFIDPDGMQAIDNDDIFQVDQKGKITQIEAEGEDVLVVVDKDGKEVGNRVNIGDDANLRQFGDTQVLEISDQSKAEAAFTEIADNTKKEFALINKENTDTGAKDSAIVGNGSTNENIGDGIAQGLYDGYGYVVTDITHNHPRNTPPSGYYINTGENINPANPIGDARNATSYPTNSNGQPIIRKVYTPKDKKTYTYDNERFYPPTSK